MAIDHRIIQQIGVKDNAPVLNMFQNALTNNQSRKIRGAQEARQAELQPFRNQILQQQVSAGEAQAGDQQKARVLKSINDFALGNATIIDNASKTGDATQLRAAMVKRSAQLQADGFSSADTDEGIAMIDAGNAGQVIGGLGDAVNSFNQQRGRGLTASQRDAADINKVLEGAIDPATGKLKPTEELTAAQEIAAIKVGLIAGEGKTTADERIVRSKDLTGKIVDFEGKKSGAKKDAEFRSKKKFQAGITRDIKLAEAAAVARGETITDLGRAEAALPGIKSVVDKLKLLSDEATFTLAGGAWDTIAKQLFGVSTKGSTARAKMVSMVDNQVLPMLKPIFGSAFTVVEGDRLRDAMLDPDSTPESRKAQLSSFFAQMQENIAGKKRELQNTGSSRVQETEKKAGGVIKVDANGNRAMVFPDGTFEELP
jgi:hypothetical protein